MSLSKISTHTGALAAAIVTSAVLFFGVPQAYAAQPTGSYYQAELVQTVTAQKELLRGVYVKCAGTSCTAPIASSAAKNMCISIAREFGAVSTFKVGEREFNAAEIEKCNGKNKVQVAKK